MKAWTLFKNWLIVKLGGYTEEQVQYMHELGMRGFSSPNSFTRNGIQKSFNDYKHHCLPLAVDELEMYRYCLRSLRLPPLKPLHFYKKEPKPPSVSIEKCLLLVCLQQMKH